MNGRIPEHIFYSLTPKLTPQAAQSVRKAGSRFLSVPRLNPERSGSGFLSEIPQPHYRIQGQPQRRGPFRSLPLVGLRLLTAQQLLGVLECILDGPSVVVTFQHLACSHRQIRRKKKIVSFLARRVFAYHQPYRLMRNPIPDDRTGIHPSLYCFTSLAKLDQCPISNIRSHLLRAGKALAFLARSATSFLPSLWRKIEYFCVALDPRNQMCFWHLPSSQSRIKAVCDQSKSPFWQPLMELIDHLHRQFYQGIAVLSMQSHMDRQSQWFSAPGRLNLQCQNHQIQSPRIDNVLLCRTDSISPLPGAMDLPAAVMEQGIVQSNSNNTSGTKDFDQHNRQALPEFVDIPSGIWKKAMIRIVSTF